VKIPVPTIRSAFGAANIVPGFSVSAGDGRSDKFHHQ
jgi:hypothetical protein